MSADVTPFFWNTQTGEPCPRRGNVMCDLPYDPAHRHANWPSRLLAAAEARGEQRVRDAAEAVERDLRLDNADLARQLSDASARRADAYDEGYDAAYAWAHSVVNRLGYLERGRDDNENPYRHGADS